MNFPPLFRSLHSSLFIAFHCLSSPFIAFHRLSLPFIAFHYLSSPPHLIVRPLSALPFCPHLAPFCPHLAPFCPRLAPVLSSPRPALSPCPRIPPLHTCFPPASSPPLFHTSVFHAPLSAPLCFASLFLLSLFYSLHCFTPLCFIYSHCFAPVFLLPGNLRKPVPDTAKGNVFLIFQRNFAKSP